MNDRYREQARISVYNVLGATKNNELRENLIAEFATALRQADKEGYERGAIEHKTADSYFKRLEARAEERGERRGLERAAESVEKAHDYATIEDAQRKIVAHAIRLLNPTPSEGERK